MKNQDSQNKQEQKSTPSSDKNKSNQTKTLTPEAKVKENPSKDDKQTGDARGKVGQQSENKNSPSKPQVNNTNNSQKK